VDVVRRQWTDRDLRVAAVSACALAGLLVAATPLVALGVASRVPPSEAPYDWFDLAIGPVWGAAGLLLVLKRPRNPIGWLLVAFVVTGSISGFSAAYALRGHAFPAEHLAGVGVALMAASAFWPAQLFLPVTVLLVLYPTGHLPAPWWRWVNWTAASGMALVAVGLATLQDSIDDWWPSARPAVGLPDAAGVPVLLVGAAALLATAAVTVLGAFVRTWRARAPERQQLSLLLVTGIVAAALPFLTQSDLPFRLALLAVPVAIVVGVLRYGLLGIDVVVRRTVLYGALTALVVVVFVGVTALLSAAVPEGPMPQVLAAAVVATCLFPVRTRLQRLVDRLFYGERSDPVGALTRLSSQVMDAEAAPLPGVLASLADAVRSPYVAFRANDGALRASAGVPVAAATLVVPLGYAGAPLGELVVTARPGEHSLPAADRRLVEALAPQVGFVVHAAHLNDELETARRRAVLTGLAERDRLRRDLHDGLGPSLSGVALGLEASQTALAGGDTATATGLAGRLRTEMATAIEEVRRIIDGLRPPALDQVGLVTALRARAEAINTRAGGRLRVRVEAPDRMPDLPGEVELAAFRIAEEALTNVVRHAGAQECLLRITTEAGLNIEVRDDGRGLPAVPRQGVGLDSMRRRAEALGGSLRLENGDGTLLAAHLPVVSS
jgi:signal transduction histidine kinase